MARDMHKHPRNCFQGSLTMPSFTKLQISLDWGLTTGFNPEILLWMRNAATARTFIHSFFSSVFAMVKLPSGTCFELRRCGEVMSFLRKGEVEIKSWVWSLARVFPSSGTVNKNKIKKASKSRPPRHRSRSDGQAAKLALICGLAL